MSTPGQDSSAMEATLGPISSVSAAADPGTASTSAGASDATDSRCGLRCRPDGLVLVVRLGRASGPSDEPPRWGSGAPRWGRSEPASDGPPRCGKAAPRWGSEPASDGPPRCG